MCMHACMHASNPALAKVSLAHLLYSGLVCARQHAPAIFTTIATSKMKALLPLTCLAACLIVCIRAQNVQQLLDNVRNLVSPPNPINTIDMPDCLVTLSGGIEAIERTLLDSLDAGKTWTVLITSKNDRSSIPAVEQYYGAVRTVCREVQPEGARAEEAESQSRGGGSGEPAAVPTFEGLGEQSGSIDGYSSEEISYRFAHLSFDDEPGMMWRWWIWKVPSIVFVTPSSSVERTYDTRFWKIAWSIPSTQKVVSVVLDRLWEQLPVWESGLAPGGMLQIATIYFASAFEGVYRVLDPIPNWILAIVGSFLGSVLLSFLHRRDATQDAASVTRKDQ